MLLSFEHEEESSNLSEGLCWLTADIRLLRTWNVKGLFRLLLSQPANHLPWYDQYGLHPLFPEGPSPGHTQLPTDNNFLGHPLLMWTVPDRILQFPLSVHIILYRRRYLRNKKGNETTPQTHITSSSPDGAFIPPSTHLNNFKQFQELMKKVAHTLQKDSIRSSARDQHQLPDILHTPSSAWVALLINEAFLEPAKMIWQTPATAPHPWQLK